MRTRIVVPCYNEAKRLDVCAFEKFLQAGDDVGFLFVDDGSTDETAQVIQMLVERHHESMSLHRLPHNRGKGEAVRSGVLKAFDFAPEYIGIWDADLAAPLNEIARFAGILDTMPRIILVTGARVRMMGRVIERSGTRHYMGRFAATLISMVLGNAYYDTQCGAKLFRATDVMRQSFAEPFLSRWIFDVELLARLNAMSREHAACNPRDCVYELPLMEWRHKGDSKIRTSSYLLSLIELGRIFRKYS